jgi:hypothetical protein
LIRLVKTIPVILAVFVVISTSYTEEPLTESARIWKKMEENTDKNNIRFSSEMYTDTSGKFLAVPENYAGKQDFDVAGTPPTIDFGIIQGCEPWYLPVSYRENYSLGGIWEGYGDVTKGPDDCYYWSIGDHRSYSGNAYIFRYNPQTKTQRIVVDLRKTVGWTPDDFADGKIHGDLDIGPGGDMWFLSYFGPGPTQNEWDTVYKGSWLFRYNIFTGECENLGIPLEGSSWPYYNYDWERGLFFGAAERMGIVIVFDTRERRMLYGGAPKNGISWHRRATMLDRDTGIFYSTDTITYHEGERYRGDHYFVSYRRRNNTFTRMDAKVPANPFTGKPAPLRAHTNEKDDNGAFWCFSQNGAFFKFYPAEDRTELIGTNWGETDYITNMCFSPKKRYIYYMSRSAGCPIIQYDTITDSKKVIAFLYDFYVEKYGYGHGKFYGIELDREGKSLFFFSNGGFVEKGGEVTYKRPSMVHLHIPESERME